MCNYQTLSLVVGCDLLRQGPLFALLSSIHILLHIWVTGCFSKSVRHCNGLSFRTPVIRHLQAPRARGLIMTSPNLPPEVLRHIVQYRIQSVSSTYKFKSTQQLAMVSHLFFDLVIESFLRYATVVSADIEKQKAKRLESREARTARLGHRLPGSLALGNQKIVSLVSGTKTTPNGCE